MTTLKDHHRAKDTFTVIALIALISVGLAASGLMNQLTGWL